MFLLSWSPKAVNFYIPKMKSWFIGHNGTLQGFLAAKKYPLPCMPISQCTGQGPLKHPDAGLHCLDSSMWQYYWQYINMRIEI
jgi:hypothetical protein